MIGREIEPNQRPLVLKSSSLIILALGSNPRCRAVLRHVTRQRTLSNAVTPKRNKIVVYRQTLFIGRIFSLVLTDLTGILDENDCAVINQTAIIYLSSRVMIYTWMGTSLGENLDSFFSNLNDQSNTQECDF